MKKNFNFIRNYKPKFNLQINTEKQNNCNVCGDIIFEYYSSGYDYEINTNSNLWVFEKCLKCGHVQMNNFPGKENIDLIYPSNYYSYSMTEKLNPFILLGKEYLDTKKIKFILKEVDIKLPNYLDIGCGDGRYLKAVNRICRISKDKIYGVELKKDVLEKLKLDGYKTLECNIEDLKGIKKESIGLITMFHVIEHVKDPKSIIKMLNNLLISGGFLVIETPNIESLDAKIFKETFWGGYHFPRHWHLFCPKSLSFLAESTNFKIRKISYLTGHSFWLYSFHHYFKYHLRLPFIAKLFDPLKSKIFLILVTIFDTLRSSLGFKTSSMLFILQKDDKNFSK